VNGAGGPHNSFSGNTSFEVTANGQSSYSGNVAACEEFLTAAEGGQYDHAYAMLADEWKQKIPRDKFPELFKLMHDTFGSRRSLSMRGIKLWAATSGTVARADYAATFEKGEAELTFNLKKRTNI